MPKKANVISSHQCIPNKSRVYPTNLTTWICMTNQTLIGVFFAIKIFIQDKILNFTWICCCVITSAALCVQQSTAAFYCEENQDATYSMVTFEKHKCYICSSKMSQTWIKLQQSIIVKFVMCQNHPPLEYKVDIIRKISFPLQNQMVFKFCLGPNPAHIYY